MTDNNTLLNETIKEVRALLLAEKNGLDLNKFLKIYKEMIGHSLPFKELGYQKPEFFLSSIKSVVEMRFNHFNEIHLTAVADQSTQHISNMVQRQKPSKNSRAKSAFSSRKALFPNFTPYFQNSYNPYYNMSYSSNISRVSSQVKNSTEWTNKNNIVQGKPKANTIKKELSINVPQKQPKNVPKTTKEIPKINTNEIIHSTNSRISSTKSDHQSLTSPDLQVIKVRIINIVKENNVNGIRKCDLQSEYKQKFGTVLDYTAFGFGTLQSFLKEIPSLLPKYEGDVLRIFYRHPDTPRINSPKPSFGVGSETRILYTWPSKTSDESKNLSTNSNGFISCGNQILSTNNSNDSVKICSPKNINVKDETDSKISDTLKRKFKEILQNNPRGIFGRMFLSKFKEQYNEDLDLKELNYCNLIDLVDALPDVFVRSRPSDCKSDWLLFDADSQIMQKLKPKDVLSIDFLENIVSNTRKILQAYPDGIFIDEFIHVYSLNTETNLNISELGFDSLTKFFLVIKNSVPLKFDYSNIRTKIRLAIDAFATAMSATFPEIPKDAVPPGSGFKPQKLPIMAKGQYFEMYMGNIIDPSLIYIQLKGQDTSVALMKLIKDIENFYSSDVSHEYIIQPQHIIVGAVCAAVWDFDNTWYRATITSVDMNHVTVIFNDYGNCGKVSKDILRYLKKEYLDLPAQAIKSRMAFLAPISPDGWDMKVKNRLLQVCSDKPLMGEVVYSAQYPNIVSLWICDSTGEDDDHINLKLCTENLAKYCDEQEHNVPDNEEVLKAFMTIYSYQNSVQPMNFHNSITNFPMWLNNQLQMLSPNNQPFNQLFTNHFLPNKGINGNVMPNLTQPNQYMPNLMSPSMPRYFDGVPAQFNNLPNPGTTNLSINMPTIPPVSTIPSTYINPPKNSHDKSKKEEIWTTSSTTPISDLTGEEEGNESDEEDFLVDEDDDAFYEICEQHGYVQRFVLRVKLQFGYKIHIIIIDELPHVTSDEITHLFWPLEIGNVLQRRLHQNNISIKTTTIYEQDCPVIFKQLRCLEVDGIYERDNKMCVKLYQLVDLIRILNAFGHPSPTIRCEISHELKKFDLKDELWQYFIELNLSEDVDEKKEENYASTDLNKFNKMCSYDLKASVEGLRFKKTKLERFVSTETNTALQEELEKLEVQCERYETRIKEIEELSHSLNLPD